MTEEVFLVGTPTIIPHDSPDGHHSAFFEDDGETGYFYALDLSRTPDMILDAVHIYDVASVVDRDRPSKLKIVWSKDGSRCALLINDYPHAAFDFFARRGYCRTNFPNFRNPEDGSWMKADHSWADGAVSWIGQAE
jgi:hypothetical protein